MEVRRKVANLLNVTKSNVTKSRSARTIKLA